MPPDATIDFSSHVGPALVRERERAGLTVYALAKLSGVSRSYLANVEAGTKIPSVEIALRLAETLGCSLAILDRPKRIPK